MVAAPMPSVAHVPADVCPSFFDDVTTASEWNAGFGRSEKCLSGYYRGATVRGALSV